MTGVFTLELLAKVIACGFLFNGKGSYLRNFWNVMDFIIIIPSVSFRLIQVSSSPSSGLIK